MQPPQNVPKFANKIDDPETYHHGPVAVQIVGRRLREEQILEIAETVSIALHGQ
jgi:Asp-tRNA(Asn)/Glu-tRNA(Gln) amidotransferase A subunit family amidase